MSGLLGPILLQVVTLSVADRTEVRVVHADTNYSEASTSPGVGLNFRWQHTALSISYGPPRLTLSPLDSKNPTLLVNQSAAVGVAYRWRRTTVTVSESGSYGKVNFQQQALAGTAPDLNAPAPATGANNQAPPAQPATPPPGTTLPAANQYLANGEVVRYGSLSSNVRLTQAITPTLSLGGGVGYVVSGSLDSKTATDYPLVRGVSVDTSAAYRLNLANDLTSSVGTQFAVARKGNSGWFLAANESLGHRFDTRTAARVGGGLSVSRSATTDGAILYSIYPTFSASISRVTPQVNGAFAYGAALSAAPALDPVRATVDPRLSMSLFAGWGYGDFSTSLSAGSAISLVQQNDQGAFNSFSAAIGAALRLADAVSVSTGVRAFRQSFQGATTVPTTYAAYLGLSLGALVPISR